MYISYEEFEGSVYEGANELACKYPQLRSGQAVFNHISDLGYEIDGENITKIVMNEGVDCFYDDKQIKQFIQKCYEKLSVRI